MFAKGLERAAEIADQMHEFAVGANYTQSWKDCAKEIARAIREQANNLSSALVSDPRNVRDDEVRSESPADAAPYPRKDPV